MASNEVVDLTDDLPAEPLLGSSGLPTYESLTPRSAPRRSRDSLDFSIYDEQANGQQDEEIEIENETFAPQSIAPQSEQQSEQHQHQHQHQQHQQELGLEDSASQIEIPSQDFDSQIEIQSEGIEPQEVEQNNDISDIQVREVKLIDDNNNPQVPSQASEERKRQRHAERRANKRRRKMEEFEARLARFPVEERGAVRSACRRVLNLKQEMWEYREGIEREGNSKYKHIVYELSGYVDRMDGYLEVIANCESGAAAKEVSTKAEAHAQGIRAKVESSRNMISINEMQDKSRDGVDRSMLNDPAYVNARSSSMVTAEPTTTRSLYNPGLNPAQSNQIMMQRALMDPLGFLPDGTRLTDNYAAGDISIVEDMQRNANTYDIYRGASIHDQPHHDMDQFEHLVELALNDAEPLDMPPQMNCQALEHQRQGLGWLLRAEKGKNRGSILADDMGLGKTVQTIGLIYANAIDPELPKEERLTLIVCPVALIATWSEELKQRVKEEFHLNVYIHHKMMNHDSYTMSAREISLKYDIVICTYGAITQEFKVLSEQLKARTHPQERNLSLLRRRKPLFDIKWNRVVLDEAHTIKNRMSQISIAVSHLKARYRLALSGTPMQNSLEELYPLLRFLKIDPYDDYSQFKRIVPPKNASRVKDYTSAKNMAALLSAVLLRRKKDTVINGRKIIDSLPDKHIKKIEITMPEEEASEYKALESLIQSEVRRLTMMEEFSMQNMLVFLLRMRQSACHPRLIIATKLAANKSVWGHNKHTKNMVHVALQCYRSRGDAFQLHTNESDLICAACSGPLLDASQTSIMSTCGHMLCSECAPEAQQRLSEDFSAICGLCNATYGTLANLEVMEIVCQLGEQMNRTPSTEDVTQALITAQGPRLMELREEERIRQQAFAEMREMLEEKEAATLDFGFDSDFSDIDDDVDVKPNVSHNRLVNGNRALDKPEIKSESSKVSRDVSLVQSNNESNEMTYSNEDIIVEDETAPEPTNPAPETDPSTWRGDPKNDPMFPKLDIQTVAKLFKVRDVFPEGWVTSAKVESCINILGEIWREAPSDKVIIFSSFTTLLDILTIPLDAAVIPYELYTGKMGPEDRNSALERFKYGSCKVLLTSLKAGNVGLTLTQANRVILMEPFWNPYVEDQAQDRVYRIGQSREVTIYRLLVKDTVEDRIVDLQTSKRETIENTLEHGMKTKSQGLNRNDMLFALGLRDRN